jgi:DedD protein
MDRQLAQRMVGAACLLAVLVLVVPAILDGNPDSDAVISQPVDDDSLDLRTHTIHLDGEEREPPVPTPVQAPPADASAPPAPDVPEAEPPAPASPPATAVAVTPGKPAATVPPAGPKPAPVRDLSQEPVKPAAPAPAKAGDWIVQLGSFSQRANADRLAADLERKGFSASVEQGGGPSGKLFRVRAGPVADRAAAEALAGRLKSAGFRDGRVGRQ